MALKHMAALIGAFSVKTVGNPSVLLRMIFLIKTSRDNFKTSKRQKNTFCIDNVDLLVLLTKHCIWWQQISQFLSISCNTHLWGV